MPSIGANPIDQITGSWGLQKQVKWADMLDSGSDNEGEALNMSLMEDELQVIEKQSEKQGEGLSVKSRADDSNIITASKEAEETMISRVVNELESETEYKSAKRLSLTSIVSSSSSSSSEDLPTSIERRPLYHIGEGVHCLCEVLRFVRIGRVDRPSIYYHDLRNKEKCGPPVRIRAVGLIPGSSCNSSPQSSFWSSFSSTSTAPPSQSLHSTGNRFTPRRRTRSRLAALPLMITPPHQPLERGPHPPQQHQPNYAPFYAKRKMEQRAREQQAMAQLQAQHQFNQKHQQQQLRRSQHPPPLPYLMPTTHHERWGHYDAPPHTTQWRFPLDARGETQPGAANAWTSNTRGETAWNSRGEGAGLEARGQGVVWNDKGEEKAHNPYAAEYTDPPEPWQEEHIELVRKGILNRTNYFV